jgi:hypothetical protein
VSGNTHGPRIDRAGYQAPRTDAVSLRREKPLARETFGHHEAVVELVPYTGGKPGTFMVDATWVEIKEVAGQVGPTTVTNSAWFDGTGEERARAFFREVCAGFERGEIPPWPEPYLRPG